jgi:hypothetical protein
LFQDTKKESDEKRLVGCLWIFVGVCIGLAWVIADILTHNPINKLNPFNDAILIVLLTVAAAYVNWQMKK